VAVVEVVIATGIETGCPLDQLIIVWAAVIDFRMSSVRPTRDLGENGIVTVMIRILLDMGHRAILIIILPRIIFQVILLHICIGKVQMELHSFFPSKHGYRPRTTPFLTRMR
jgi:hypothetical protein